VTPDSPSAQMEESRRLLRALPLRLTLGVVEALAAGGSEALGRVQALCREVSRAQEKELKSSARKERFSSSVVKDIERL